MALHIPSFFSKEVAKELNQGKQKHVLPLGFAYCLQNRINLELSAKMRCLTHHFPLCFTFSQSQMELTVSSWVQKEGATLHAFCCLFLVIFELLWNASLSQTLSRTWEIPWKYPSLSSRGHRFYGNKEITNDEPEGGAMCPLFLHYRRRHW